MASKATLKLAEELLDRFFRDAEGKAQRRLDVYFTIEDMGVAFEKAEPALEYLHSRGLIDLFDFETAMLSERGVEFVIDEKDIRKLPPFERVWGSGAPAPVPPNPIPASPAEPDPTPPANPAAARPEKPQITYADPTGITTTITLGWLCTLGRTEQNTVQLNDKRSSKHHAEIRFAGDRYIVKDLGSANGTMVNDEYIEGHALQHGDELIIGRTLILYECPTVLREPKGSPAAEAAALEAAASPSAPEPVPEPADEPADEPTPPPRPAPEPIVAPSARRGGHMPPPSVTGAGHLAEPEFEARPTLSAPPADPMPPPSVAQAAELKTNVEFDAEARADTIPPAIEPIAPSVRRDADVRVEPATDEMDRAPAISRHVPGDIAPPNELRGRGVIEDEPETAAPAVVSRNDRQRTPNPAMRRRRVPIRAIEERNAPDLGVRVVKGEPVRPPDAPNIDLPADLFGGADDPTPAPVRAEPPNDDDAPLDLFMEDDEPEAEAQPEARNPAPRKSTDDLFGDRPHSEAPGHDPLGLGTPADILAIQPPDPTPPPELETKEAEPKADPVPTAAIDAIVEGDEYDGATIAMPGLAEALKADIARSKGQTVPVEVPPLEYEDEATAFAGADEMTGKAMEEDVPATALDLPSIDDETAHEDEAEDDVAAAVAAAMAGSEVERQVLAAAADDEPELLPLDDTPDPPKTRFGRALMALRERILEASFDDAALLTEAIDRLADSPVVETLVSDLDEV